MERTTKIELPKKAGMSILIVILLLITYTLFIRPLLLPWWAEQMGKAELAQAEQNRQRNS